jgi:hypothetical protein
MVVRSIPVERPQTVEVWHAASPARPADPREDRLIAVVVDIPRRYRVPVRGTEVSTDWPAPIIPLISPAVRS